MFFVCLPRLHLVIGLLFGLCSARPVQGTQEAWPLLLRQYERLKALVDKGSCDQLKLPTQEKLESLEIQVTTPRERRQELLESYQLILHREPKHQRLILGCGNDRKALYGRALTEQEQETHSHQGWDTLDLNPLANPTIVANCNMVGWTLFLGENSYNQVLIENVYLHVHPLFFARVGYVWNPLGVPIQLKGKQWLYTRLYEDYFGFWEAPQEEPLPEADPACQIVEACKHRTQAFIQALKEQVDEQRGAQFFKGLSRTHRQSLIIAAAQEEHLLEELLEICGVTQYTFQEKPPYSPPAWQASVQAWMDSYDEERNTRQRQKEKEQEDRQEKGFSLRRVSAWLIGGVLVFACLYLLLFSLPSQVPPAPLAQEEPLDQPKHTPQGPLLRGGRGPERFFPVPLSGQEEEDREEPCSAQEPSDEATPQPPPPTQP